MNKKVLRSDLKQIRSSLSQSRREEASSALFEQLFPMLDQARHVLSFVSFSHEIDTSLINLHLAQTGRLLLPKIDNHNLMPFRVSSLNQLKANHFGLMEPDPHLCLEIDVSSIDLILVPALGFDMHNHRLGYGFGFYDRLLKTISHATTIGIGFKEQLVPLIPFQAHDVPLEKVSLF